MRTPPLTAGRVHLTPLAETDAAEMAEVLAGDALYTFIGGSAPTLEQLRHRYARQAAGSPDPRQEWHNWIIRTTAGGRAVGYVQATVTENGGRAEIAWVVGLAWQGRGYAAESARAMVAWLRSRGIVEIVAHIHPDHTASAAVARRVGLEPTDEFHHGERLWRAPLPPDAA
ncbi:GNAT family N-acetyltransferase [Microtetraspora sp. NBRC 13810]|uniref:GNAT family N-acetyltransferase n=1 Tax=Microtetraspora sp. NBRC 13810 TaxID=3030990 RepID=UPI002555377B|nr:GNAT family N-acetyltransferase [Microtetraspora sp. NBRC 13810]